MSPFTRLVAAESKATNRPSAETAASALEPLDWIPVEDTLTRPVAAAAHAREAVTKASALRKA